MNNTVDIVILSTVPFRLNRGDSGRKQLIMTATAIAASSATFRKLAVLLIVAGIGTAAWYQWKNASSVSPETTTSNPPVTRTEVHALGRLEPAGTILQLAPESGNEGAIVRELLVKEGDDVQSGAVLAVFDNIDRRKAKLAEASARLEAARAKLDQVKAGTRKGEIQAQEAVVALAQKQSQVAAKELSRAKELHLRKALNDEQLDTQQWEYDRLILEHQRAIGLLDSLKEIRETDVRLAEKEIAAAEAAVTMAESELHSSSLRAPADGRILRIHTYPGERLNDRGLIEMGDVRHMQAVAEVFEGDVPLLSEGLEAEVVVDGSGERLSGTVQRIGHVVARKIVLTNDPVSDTDARVVEVRIALDNESIAKVQRLANTRIEVHIHLKRSPEQVTDHGSVSSN